MTKAERKAVMAMHVAGAEPEAIARALKLPFDDVRRATKTKAPQPETARPKAPAAATADHAELQRIATNKRHEEMREVSDLIRRSWRTKRPRTI